MHGLRLEGRFTSLNVTSDRRFDVDTPEKVPFQIGDGQVARRVAIQLATFSLKSI